MIEKPPLFPTQSSGIAPKQRPLEVGYVKKDDYPDIEKTAVNAAISIFDKDDNDGRFGHGVIPVESDQAKSLEHQRVQNGANWQRVAPPPPPMYHFEGSKKDHSANA